jgi:hypothetical protein
MCFEPLPQAGGRGGGVQCCDRFIGNKTFFSALKNLSLLLWLYTSTEHLTLLYSTLAPSQYLNKLVLEKYICRGEPAISLHSHHVSLAQWTTHLLPVTRDLGSKPLGDLCETGILLLALSRYIGDPDVIDHCGLV